MLIKRLPILWIKIHVSKPKRIYLNIPLSLYALEELLDCTMDLLSVASFLIPKQQQKNSSMSIDTIKALMKELIYLMDSMKGIEPYDFVNVEANNVEVDNVEVKNIKVSIKII